MHSRIVRCGGSNPPLFITFCRFRSLCCSPRSRDVLPPLGTSYQERNWQYPSAWFVPASRLGSCHFFCPEFGNSCLAVSCDPLTKINCLPVTSACSQPAGLLEPLKLVPKATKLSVPAITSTSSDIKKAYQYYCISSDLTATITENTIHSTNLDCRTSDSITISPSTTRIFKASSRGANRGQHHRSGLSLSNHIRDAEQDTEQKRQ